MEVPRIVEIRTYKLSAGSGAEFHRLVHERSIPMVRRWGHDVIAYGPSLTDPDSYFLIRAYESVDHMRSSQDEFYSSDEWKSGPREGIVSLIESQTEIVLELPVANLEMLRVGLAPVL
jgi:hypothetical protein